jgi:hypothetical protein
MCYDIVYIIVTSLLQFYPYQDAIISMAIETIFVVIAV